MSMIECFLRDKWEIVPVSQLKGGELVRQADQLYDVKGPVYMKDGVPTLPADIHNPGPIKLAIGEHIEGIEHIVMAMDLLGADLREFPDNTGLLAIFELGDGYIYSPRLPMEELEAFCRRHIERYQAFFDEHIEDFDKGNNVPMVPWWNQDGTTE